MRARVANLEVPFYGSPTPPCRPPARLPTANCQQCRKHLRTRRLNGISQLGDDRVIILTFGAGETAYHLIVELYDKGNIILTDHSYGILSLLRPRSDKEDVVFGVHERYPIENAYEVAAVTREKLAAQMLKAKDKDPLRKLLNPLLGKHLHAPRCGGLACGCRAGVCGRPCAVVRPR